MVETFFRHRYNHYRGIYLFIQSSFAHNLSSIKTKYFENLQWTNSGKLIVLHHAAVLLGLPFYFYFTPPQWSMVLASCILLYCTVMGIGAGYHRLYSHCAYRLKKSVEAVFLFFATMAFQGSALRWSYDHRMHHLYVDRAGDPYNVKKGFWYAHVLWLFEKQPNIEQKVIPDLYANKLVMFQHRHYIVLSILNNIIACLFLGWILGDFVGAFVLGWGVRLLVSYHITWFINSIAHYWGEQSYSKELSARDNAILALLTVGEGYHNYHHTFPADYRNGSRFYHFDPVKWVVWIMSKTGLATQLRRFHHDHVMERLIGLDTSLLLKRLSELKQMYYENKNMAASESLITRMSESLKMRYFEMKKLIEEYRALRRARADKSIRRSMKSKIKECRLHYTREWKRWCELCKTVLNSKLMKYKGQVDIKRLVKDS